MAATRGRMLGGKIVITIETIFCRYIELVLTWPRIYCVTLCIVFLISFPYTPILSHCPPQYYISMTSMISTKSYITYSYSKSGLNLIIFYINATLWLLIILHQ